MSAFLTALASVGSQYAEGKDQARQEREAKSEREQRLGFEKSYLDIAGENAKRQQDQLEFEKKRGRFIDLGLPIYSKSGKRYKQFWDVAKGSWNEVELPGGGTGGLDALKTVMQSLTPEQQNLAKSRYETTLGATGDENKALERAQDLVDKLAEQNTRHKEHEEDVQESEKFRREQSAEMRNFQRQMVDFRLQEKSKFMTPQERQQWESIKTVEPMVDRLNDFLEKNKLIDENAYVFGNHSALAQHMRMLGYKAGVEQEAVTQELIKDAAAISIMGAAPWVRIGRGKYTLEQIQQHLPKPTDTPGNLYDKVTWLRDEVIANAKESLSGLNPPGASQPVGDSKSDSDPLGVLP